MVHLFHQRIDLIFLKSYSNFFQNTCLNMSLKMVDIISRHIFDVIIESQQWIHLFSQLTCFKNFLQPFLNVFSWKKDLPTINSFVICLLVFYPKSSNSLTRFFFAFSVLISMSFLVLNFLFSLLINQNNIFKLLRLLIVIKCWQSFLLF